MGDHRLRLEHVAFSKKLLLLNSCVYLEHLAIEVLSEQQSQGRVTAPHVAVGMENGLAHP